MCKSSVNNPKRNHNHKRKLNLTVFAKKSFSNIKILVENNVKGSLHKIQVRFSFVISNQNVKKLSKNRTGEKEVENNK